MAETFQQNQIASGNDNAAGLTNIETIAVDGQRFAPVDDLGKWRGGNMVYRNGLLIPQGYASTSWVSGSITLEQWYYLYHTILSDAVSGPVTIRTRKYDPAAYANYNAILYIGQPPDETKQVDRYTGFVWRFTKVVAL